MSVIADVTQQQQLTAGISVRGGGSGRQTMLGLAAKADACSIQL
jgi:hypothetical protein